MARNITVPPLRSTLGVVPVVQDGWSISASYTADGAALAQSTPSPGADTYETLLTITGSGWLDHLTVVSGSTTSRTITVQILVDSQVVWTSVSGTITSASQGRALLGAVLGTSGYGAQRQPIRFNTSLEIKMKDSVGVDGGQTLYYSARTE